MNTIMKKNISRNFLFTPYTNFFDDIDCLIKFARQPLLLDEFFEKIPTNILNAKLCELEFESENHKNPPYLLITLKTSNKICKVKLNNNHLSPLGITITDQNQLIAPLLDAKNKLSKSILKDQLSILIKTIFNTNRKLSLTSGLCCIKDKTLSLSENKNKQSEINIFFSFIEKFLIQDNDSKNPIYINAESLSFAVNYFSKLELRYPNLNTLISEILTNLNKPFLNNISIEKVLLAYEKLHYEASLVFPEVEKSKNSSLIDNLIRIKADNPITFSNFDFFRLSFLEKKGLRYIFGNEEDIKFFEDVQKTCKNFSCLKESYLKIVNTIHELYIFPEKNQKIIDLSKQLNDLTDLYFEKILHKSNSNDNENFEEYRKKAFIKFQNKVRNNINKFKKENLLSLKQLDTLSKLLNYIAKLIPSFILSKEERIRFFQSHTPQNKKIDRILSTIKNKFTYNC